jgi:hypothetical protein
MRQGRDFPIGDPISLRQHISRLGMMMDSGHDKTPLSPWRVRGGSGNAARAAGVLLAAALPFVAMATAEAAPIFGSFGSAVWGGIDTAQCASPQGSFNFLGDSPCFFSFAGAGSRSDGATGSSAAAQADLAQGFVSVQVSGTTFIPNVGNGSSYAHALVWDTLTFSGAAPGASVTITMSGTAGLSGDARIGAVAVLFDLANVGAIGSPPSLLEGNGTDPVAPGAYSVQRTFSISNDVPMLLAIGVSAFAGVTGAGDPLNLPPPGEASINDPFSLALPDGVTFTAASVTSVSEPGTLALLAAGVFGVGAARKRRR